MNHKQAVLVSHPSCPIGLAVFYSSEDLFTCVGQSFNIKECCTNRQGMDWSGRNLWIGIIFTGKWCGSKRELDWEEQDWLPHFHFSLISVRIVSCRDSLSAQDWCLMSKVQMERLCSIRTHSVEKIWAVSLMCNKWKEKHSTSENVLLGIKISSPTLCFFHLTC